MLKRFFEGARVVNEREEEDQVVTVEGQQEVSSDQLDVLFQEAVDAVERLKEESAAPSAEPAAAA